MKNLAIRYGLIGGVIVVALMFATMPFSLSGDMDMSYGQLIGYTTMLIALAPIFFAVRRLRDDHLGGTISFGKAFQLGLFITLIVSVMYVIGWFIYMEVAAPDFMEKFVTQHMEGLREAGASAEKIAEEQEKMDGYIEMYKNPFIKFGMTFMEIFPVGLVVSVICAFILRTKS